MALKERLNAGLLEAGKSISDEKLEKVISILKPSEEKIIWYTNWMEFGFYLLYLTSKTDDRRRFLEGTKLLYKKMIFSNDELYSILKRRNLKIDKHCLLNYNWSYEI